MPDDTIRVAPDSTGKMLRTRSRAVGANTVHEQFVITVEDKVVTYQGRAASFRIPGRAAASQNLGAIHNATASPVLVRVNRVLVDLLSTQATPKAPTILTPILRCRRFTAVPTGGNTIVKTPRDSALNSNAAVTLWNDASADSTSSATTLTITGGGVLGQAFAQRTVAVGTGATTVYEPVDMAEFFIGEPDVILRPLEGIVVAAEAAIAAGGNPTTDFWSVVFDWDEYTIP